MFFNVIVFVVSLNCAFVLCLARYHEQYRVPHSSSKNSETYVFSDKEYILQNFPVKWTDAQVLCRGHQNGTLAILDMGEKAAFISEALSESRLKLRESVWIGARRAPNGPPGSYHWQNGAPLKRTAADVLGGEESYYAGGGHYPLWVNRTNVPVPDEGADCVALDRVYHDKPLFLDLPCNLMRGFVCERQASSSEPVRELKVTRCKSGLYRLYNGWMTWDEAAAFCVLKKMTLANVKTMQCLKKLGMSMLKSRPGIESAWVGARGERGSWVWTDSGASIFTPSPLFDGNPDLWPPMRDRNSLKQDGCLQVDLHATHAPVFLESRCERRMQFVCYEENERVRAILRTQTSPPNDDTYFYILVRPLLSWQLASDNCLDMNGTLASLESNEVLVQLLLVMGENTDEPIEHIWLSGKLNITKDNATGSVAYNWYNPADGRLIPDPNHPVPGRYMPKWLDDDVTLENSCLNLDREDHLSGLVYGEPCNTAQASICMIEKSSVQPAARKADVPTAENNIPVVETNMPVVETNMPVVETNIPVAETNIPVAETNIPVAESNVPVVDNITQVILEPETRLQDQ